MPDRMTDVRHLIAGLPRDRRPSTIFLRAIAPGMKRQNSQSLKYPAGNRADTLNETAIAALDKVLFAPSAQGMMSKRGLDGDAVMVGILKNMSLALTQHLNSVPPQMDLVIVAARRTATEQVSGETELYLAHRKDYIKWVANTVLAHNRDVAVSAFVPKGLWASGNRDMTLTLRSSNLELMAATGLVPPGWSVEHIEARGLNTGSRYKNRLGNLIIMPMAINAWTGKLDDLQCSIHFPMDQKVTPSEFLLCARPKQGPERGFLLYGINEPIKIPSFTLNQLQDRLINDLPILQAPIQSPLAPLAFTAASNATGTGPVCQPANAAPSDICWSSLQSRKTSLPHPA